MKIGSIYLQTIQYNCRQAQPAVQTVHVGDLGRVMKVKNGHHGNNSENEGCQVQACMDELHHEFTALPGPGKPVDNYGCKRGSVAPSVLKPHKNS